MTTVKNFFWSVISIVFLPSLLCAQSASVVFISDGTSPPRPAVQTVASASSGRASALDLTIGDIVSNEVILRDGDRLSDTPVVRVTLSSSADITSWNISLINSDTHLVVAEENELYGVSTQSVTAIFTQSTPVVRGTYEILVSVKDADGDTESKSILRLRIGGKLQISEALLGPNPFSPLLDTAAIDYHLSMDSDVEMTILSLSGRTVYKTSFSAGQNGGRSGFNQVEWDGRDRQGDLLANGPYLIYLVAKSGGNMASTRIKVMVLK